jgi:NMD protein affecting ribosome stability and mRNA decay
MEITLIDRKCQNCGIKLTEFEINEKSSLCMECFEEKYPSEKFNNKPKFNFKRKNRTI